MDISLILKRWMQGWGIEATRKNWGITKIPFHFPLYAYHSDKILLRDQGKQYDYLSYYISLRLNFLKIYDSRYDEANKHINDKTNTSKQGITKSKVWGVSQMANVGV